MTMLLLLQVLQVDWWTVSRCKSSYARCTISYWRLAVSCEHYCGVIWSELVAQERLVL